MSPELTQLTNPEIAEYADRVSCGLVAYALSEVRDLLGTDAIGEAIGDDPEANRLDGQARGIVYGLVWDQLGRAAVEYQRTAPAAL